MESNPRIRPGHFRDYHDWPEALRLEYDRRVHFLRMLGHEERHARQLAMEQLRPVRLSSRGPR